MLDYLSIHNGSYGYGYIHRRSHTHTKCVLWICTTDHLPILDGSVPIHNRSSYPYKVHAIFEPQSTILLYPLYTVDVIFIDGVYYSRLQWIIILISRGSGSGVAQLVERPIEKPGAILTRVRVPCAARNFSARINFQCRLPHGVRTAPVCSRMHQHLCTR